MTQINHNDSPHKAVDAIYHLSKGYAQAKAHPEYIELLEGLKVAVEKEQEYYWKLKAAESRIEVWRTECANSRRELTASNMT